MRSFALILAAVSFLLSVPSLNAEESVKPVKSKPASPATGKKQQVKPKSQATNTQNALPQTTQPVSEPKPEQKKERAEQQSQRPADSGINWAGWAQVLVGGVGLFIIWRTLKAVEQQAEANRITATAALEEARATVISANLAREEHLTTHRPRIVVRHIVVQTANNNSSLSIGFTGVNVGAVGGTVGQTSAQLWLPQGWPMPFPPYRDLQVRNTVLGASERDQFVHRVTDQTLVNDYTTRMALGSNIVGTSDIIVMGFIRYKDNLNRERVTGFFRKFNHSIRRFEPVNDPEYEYQD